MSEASNVKPPTASYVARQHATVAMLRCNIAVPVGQRDGLHPLRRGDHASASRGRSQGAGAGCERSKPRGTPMRDITFALKLLGAGRDRKSKRLNSSH